jgi:hypothetical protein
VYKLAQKRTFLPFFTAFYPLFTLFSTHSPPTVSGTPFALPSLASLSEGGFTIVYESLRLQGGGMGKENVEL